MSGDFVEDIQIYKEDGRPSVNELYEQYEELVTGDGWQKEIVYKITTEIPSGQVEVPVFAYFSPKRGPAFWINAGVHGEEPAGPIALGRNVGEVGELGKKIPMVAIPLFNPVGYSKDWRYYNERRDWRKGLSVGDSEHHLPDLTNPNKPRVSAPGSEIAATVTKFILDHLVGYPPVLTIDHHEDELLQESYIYSQGAKGADDPVAKDVIAIIAEVVSVQMDGKTRFGEPIKGGIVVDKFGNPVKDGSIDEFYAASRIFVNGKWVDKPAARTSLVIETPTIGVSFEKRIQVHAAVIHQHEHLWQLALAVLNKGNYTL